jgi:4-carboxymuconolactone decarboxylase
LVNFEPGARSAWHSHPVGQMLIVTAGTGWIQTWGGPIQEFHQGDIVLIPPGVKRWHGASPTSSMTHIAIQEESDGSNTTWMEKVSDEQYSQGPADTKKPLKSQGELRVAQGHVRYRGRKRNFQTLAATSNHSREDLSYEHIL